MGTPIGASTSYAPFSSDNDIYIRGISPLIQPGDEPPSAPLDADSDCTCQKVALVALAAIVLGVLACAIAVVMGAHIVIAIGIGCAIAFTAALVGSYIVRQGFCCSSFESYDRECNKKDGSGSKDLVTFDDYDNNIDIQAGNDVGYLEALKLSGLDNLLGSTKNGFQIEHIAHEDSDSDEVNSINLSPSLRVLTSPDSLNYSPISIIELEQSESIELEQI